jgi:hypothetical protein
MNNHNQPFARRHFLTSLASLSVIPALPTAAQSTDSSKTTTATPEAGVAAKKTHAMDIRTLIQDPILVNSIWKLAPVGGYAESGAASQNMEGFKFIEHQRQGAEWISAGVARKQPDWVARGWKIIDFGLQQQTEDGGFPGTDVPHSASLFLEASARSCLIDPPGATDKRLAALKKGANWLRSPLVDVKKRKHSAIFTHRRYVMAACLGQIGQLTADADMREMAEAWIEEGLAMQRPDGVNPERGGFDSSYQMVGALFAERYFPSCRSEALKKRLTAAMERAVSVTLMRQQKDGSIDISDSTRVGSELTRAGKVKGFNYPEGVQTLVFGSHLFGRQDWRQAAELMVKLNGWDNAKAAKG